jgi:hypothetical protein
MNTEKTIIGIVSLVLFFGFVWYMLELTNSAEPQWTRTVYLFNGVEAIAFAAAGFFFGREVHRERAETAEKRAETEEQLASDLQKKGVELAAQVRASLASRIRTAMYGKLGEEAQHLNEGDDRLVNLANTLFPRPQ